MSELALQRIAENKKTQNPQLDMTRCYLTKLPPELSECVWLTSLDLNFNDDLIDLSTLQSLTKLQRISCYWTRVSDLSPLAALTQLQMISCYGTQVTDLFPLSALVNLNVLDFSWSPVAYFASYSTRDSCYIGCGLYLRK